MENKIKVSLIIPVFNVSKYLEKALISAAHQTFDDYEVIIVNDGSTDNCSEIIEDFASRYENFIVINQKNAGLSAARNTGLREAKGEYVVFLDSDDFLQPDFIEEMYNLCIDNGADIGYCGHYIYMNDRRFRFYFPFTSKTNVLDKEKALNRLIRDNILHYFAWNKIYKKSLFDDNNISFPDMYFEDIATTPRLLYHSNRVAITSKPLYNYTQRSGSIMKLASVLKHNDYVKSLLLVRNFLEKQDVFEKYKKSYIYYAIRTIFCISGSVTQVHLSNHTFDGYWKNLSMSLKNVKHCLGKDFELSQSDVDIELPYYLEKPIKKKKGNRKLDTST